MARRQPFISRVRLSNYKSIASCDVRLDPLTILIGPNGSGKSNFLDALAFLARAIETTPNQALEERGGIEAILCAVPSPAMSFKIEVEFIFLWDEDMSRAAPQEYWAHGTYGFEIARAADKDKRPFNVRAESCSIQTPRRSLHYETNQGFVQDVSRDTPLLEAAIEPDHLYLPVAGTQKDYSRLTRLLREMHFYSFAYDAIREPQRYTRAAELGARGQQLTSVLSAMESRNPRHKARLDAYLRAIVPGLISVDHWAAGPYLTLKLRTSAGTGREPVEFGSNGMSDGTIRALGVLTALFQPAALSHRIPLVGIEEPEIALHPAAAGVLFDALTEASDWVQVLATSQSPDLLDRDDLDINVVRSVSMQHGLTTIGKVDEASRRIVRDKLYTLGQLMRGDQISPDNAPDDYNSSPGA